MKNALSVMTGVGLALLAAGNAIAQVSSDQQVKLEIRSQLLRDALNDWAQQTGFNLISPTSTVTSQFVVPAIHGEITARAALERLLAGTSLTYELVDNRTVVIRERSRSSTGITGWRNISDDSRQHVAMVGEDQQRSAETNGTTTPAETTGRASAQTSLGTDKDSARNLEQVIVTAQKRQERLQDVPISISVLSGRDLDRSNAVSVNDALNVSTPGVATSLSSYPGTTRLSVRGVSSSEMIGGGTSPIAYYVDSVPFGFVRSAIVPDVGSFDLQQVEALRGPQGTLYGANAANGVVRVITNDADLNNVEFKARTSVSNTEDGGTGYRGDVAINMPIIEDKLAARLTGSYASAGGWIDSLVKHDINDTKLSDVRLKVNSRPVDNLSLGLSWWHSKTDIGAFGLANSNDVYPGILDSPTTIRFDAVGLKIGFEFPGVSISSSTSYIDYKNHNNFDITPFNALFGPFDPTWVGQLGFNKDDSRVFAQEVTLISETGGAWRWTAGAFYRDAEDHYFSTAIYYDPPPNNPDYGDISRSVAAFGELTRKFSDGKFELTGGLRYFRDEVTATYVVPFQHDVDTFHHVSPRVVLNWHPSSDMTGYASYSEGFRGGFSQDALTKLAAPNLAPCKPDNLRNYEMGLKGTLLGGRITYDSAVYYMDWQDVQQHLIVPYGLAGAAAVDAIVNGGSASGPGIDLNVTTRPLSDRGGFEWGVNASWNDLTFDEDVLSDGAVLFSKGSRLNFSPEYTFGALAGYSFPLAGGGLQSRLFLSGSYHTKQIVRDANGLNGGDDLLNVHVGFSVGAPEHWTAELFVDNATNDRGNIITTYFSIPFYDMRTRPRTIGLQVDYNFSR